LRIGVTELALCDLGLSALAPAISLPMDTVLRVRRDRPPEGNGLFPIAAESGKVIGGTPAIPRIEFSSARFSARSRTTSASSARVYRVAVTRRQNSAIKTRILINE